MRKRVLAAARVAVALAVALAVTGLGGTAHAQQVTLHVQGQGRQIYAGLPFVLAVSAEGFEPEPEPTVETPVIPGCDVTFLGVAPNVSTSITIFGGTRKEERRVEFVYRYRVEAREARDYQIPAITVTQGNLRATTRSTRFTAISVPASSDMRIELDLPDRPLWVGETFDLHIDWLLRLDPGEPSFSIPLFDDPSWIDVHAPAVGNQRRREVLPIAVGDRDIEVPYTQDNVTTGGTTFTRVRMNVPVTPLKAGTLKVEPAQVVAELPVGMGRDTFGFAVRRTQLFRAEDVPRTLEIRPLPLADRPPSFAGAVGTAFSVKVQASRTVVRVGEPIELEILIRGDGRMEGLSLPPLVNAQGLPAELFTVIDSPATGELVDTGDGKGKRFRVTVRLQSADAREIPRIGFSYFDATRGQYQTAYSEPIALQVAGASVVGTADVVSAAALRPAEEAGTPQAQTPTGVGSFVGADFSLSHAGDTLAAAWTVSELWPLLLALYGAAMLIAMVRLWQVRTRERRGQSSDVKQALRAVQQALARAGSTPGREAAPELLSALRGLARVTGQRAGGDVIARIETESYSPAAATQPLDAGVRAEAEALARSWAQAQAAGADRGAGNGKGTGGPTAVAMMLLAGALLGAQPAAAAAEAQPAAAAAEAQPAATAARAGPAPASDPDPGERIEQARQAYAEALAQTERDARTRGFARAEAMFRTLVDSCPDCPALATDWGNAALGAQELGRATLAYRRALALDPGHDQAERNLTWVRERAPAWLPRPTRESAADSLFFWHYALSVPARHLIAAVSFAAAVLLLAPWGWRPRLRRGLAVVPVVVWLAMIASVVTASDPGADAVVLADATVLRTADSTGASPALPNPLPAGAEVVIREERGAWTRVALADGTTGWLSGSAIERVQPTR